MQPVPQGRLISSSAPGSGSKWPKDHLISTAKHLVKEDTGGFIIWVDGSLVLPLHVRGS